MVETAAHLLDDVFPQVPARHGPKRLRYFLSRDADLSIVSCGFSERREKGAQSCCADAPDHARLGAEATSSESEETVPSRSKRSKSLAKQITLGYRFRDDRLESGVEIPIHGRPLPFPLRLAE